MFRARDETLGRLIALKFVRPELAASNHARAIVEREARALCALAHPNICTFHDIVWDRAEPALVMECLDGETLAARLSRGRVSLGEVLPIAIDVLNGLAYAHAAGVVHRDLKPANVMLTPTGAKLFDFGIATQRPPDGGSPTGTITRTGGVVGSAAYLSPEQANGKPVDARSDLFAFGCLLYEMVSGRRAFGRETELATVAAVLEAEPEPVRSLVPEVPDAIVDVIATCLRKDPERRFQRAADVRGVLESIPGARGSRQDVPVGTLRDDRRWTGRRPVSAMVAGAVVVAAGLAWLVLWNPWAPPAASPLDSVAVLPFEGETENADLEYIADGLAESITNALSRASGIRVAARSRAFTYKGKNATAEDVGRDLNVSAVVMGKVARAGGRLRVQAELIDVAAGRQLWGQQYEGTENDLLRIQSELTQMVSQRLTAGQDPAAAARLQAGSTGDARAYQLYLRGRHAQFSMTDGGKSVGYFREALAIDPNYARAYAGLAWVLANDYSADDMLQAKAAALRALEIDPDLADGHLAMGLIRGWFDLDWGRAEPDLLRALELQPNDGLARLYYGWLLIHTGRAAAGFAQGGMGFALDPLDPFVEMAYAQMHYACGRPLVAIERLQRLVETSPGFVNAHWALAYAYLMIDRWAEAIKELDELVRVIPDYLVPYLYQAHAYARSGQQQRARERLAEGEAKLQPYPNAHYLWAVIAAVRGKHDEAIGRLQRAREESDTLLPNHLGSIDPVFAELRKDPRTEAITAQVTKAGLVDCGLPRDTRSSATPEPGAR